METVKQKRALAKAENATAWIILTTAQANHDLEQYGQWSRDYVAIARGHQDQFETAMKELSV